MLTLPPRRAVLRSLFAAATLCLAPFAPASAQTEPVRVFAAASLKTTLEASAPAFTAASGRAVTFSFAAASALAKQLEQGAPADAFISADIDWMDYAGKAGAIDTASRFNLLGNSLVVIAPAGATVTFGLDSAAAFTAPLGAEGRLALGDPSNVPAGKYAKAALENLGLWNTVSGRLAPSESVRVALAYVARGETPLGIVYRTDANAEPKVQILTQIPSDKHPPIIYPAALTKAATAGGKAYLAFLQTAAAKQEFIRQGFTVLSGK